MNHQEVRAQLKDTVVAAVIQQFIERSEVGQQKYGTTLDRTDLKPLDWVQHAQEELMDGILYLEKLKRVIKASRLLEDTLSEGTAQAPLTEKQ